MSNSLLALLNSRDMLRDMHAGQVISVHLSNLGGASNRLERSEDTHVRGGYAKDQVRRHCCLKLLALLLTLPLAQEALAISPRIPDASFDTESQVQEVSR